MLFKEVAHLYVGCRVWRKGEGGTSFIMDGIHCFPSGEVRVYDAIGHTEKIEAVKPEFTRPWELPTEVLEELLKVRVPDAYFIQVSPVTNEGVGFSFKKPVSCKGIFSRNLFWSSLSADQFTILLKAGADLFGLIDSGEAIDSKTLKGEKA